MISADGNHMIASIEHHARPLQNHRDDYNAIIDASKDCDFVLIGEASHGTYEFYKARAEITKRLIAECGFDAVAVEADWPDAWRINRYISGDTDDTNAVLALSGFERFPSWMWRNKVVENFIEWLRGYNRQHTAYCINATHHMIGFYGLDLYSMSKSIHAVIRYLEQYEPEAAIRARRRYSCLGKFIDNPSGYGYAAELGLTENCENEIIEQLIELRKKSYDYLRNAEKGLIPDDYFSTIQNAEVVRNAERYYRALFHVRQNSWNLRDRHMFDTLESIADHLSQKKEAVLKIVVWAHNSHLGNAAATEMCRRDEFNLGQFMRESYGNRCLLIGFSTCTGKVTAADDWDLPAQSKKNKQALSGQLRRYFQPLPISEFPA